MVPGVAGGADQSRGGGVFSARRGSAGAYRALAQQFAQGIAVYAVQYPGRQDRLGDPLVTSIAELADYVTADLLGWGAVPNLALFGHSMGATVAFEVARRLQRKDRDPVRLFVSGRIAPDAPTRAACMRGQMPT